MRRAVLLINHNGLRVQYLHIFNDVLAQKEGSEAVVTGGEGSAESGLDPSGLFE